MCDPCVIPVCTVLVPCVIHEYTANSVATKDYPAVCDPSVIPLCQRGVSEKKSRILQARDESAGSLQEATKAAHSRPIGQL